MNGLMRAVESNVQVVTDGNRTRYPDGLYICTGSEWMIFINLGGTAGLSVLSHRNMETGLFL